MVNRVSSTHFIQPVDVELNGDRALATSYGHITLRFSHEDSEYDMVSWGWWIHRAGRIKTPSGYSWILMAMHFIYDRDSITPTCPVPGAALQVCLDPETRKSYKYLDWVLSQRGYNISKTLAGTDDVDSIEGLKAQERGWLDSAGAVV